MKDKLIAKALKDPKFREELKKDPAAAIEKEFGVKVPAGVKVKIVEDSADSVHLVLPPAKSEEISDKDLDKVAGGCNHTCYNQCTRP
jgi:hypothetical protein